MYILSVKKLSWCPPFLSILCSLSLINYEKWALERNAKWWRLDFDVYWLQISSSREERGERREERAYKTWGVGEKEGHLWDPTKHLTLCISLEDSLFMVYALMAGLTDRDRRVDGLTERDTRKVGQRAGWVDRLTNRQQTGRQTNRRTDGQMDRTGYNGMNTSYS